MISVFWDYDCLEAAKSNTKDTQRDCSVYQVLRKVNEPLPWNSVKVKEVWVFVNISLKDISVDQRFYLRSPSFLNNSSCFFSSASDCEKQFVSFCGSSPTFLTPSEWVCRKSIYFPKIAISLVYRKKISLYQDEKESHSNLFGACLNVIMRFCCTPAILIHVRWRWWKKPVQ